MIDNLNKNDYDPTKIDLSLCSDSKIKELLERMKNTQIHKMRNKVAHDGYRPILSEVDHYLKEAKSVLFVIPRKLGVIDDDLNMYRLGV
jgi:hypothetical protein